MCTMTDPQMKIQKAKYKTSPNTQIQKRPVQSDSQIPSYLDHIPEGTSTRPFVHFAQLHKSGKIFLNDDNNNDDLDNNELVHFAQLHKSGKIFNDGDDL